MSIYAVTDFRNGYVLSIQLWIIAGDWKELKEKLTFGSFY